MVVLPRPGLEQDRKDEKRRLRSSMFYCGSPRAGQGVACGDTESHVLTREPFVKVLLKE